MCDLRRDVGPKLPDYRDQICRQTPTMTLEASSQSEIRRREAGGGGEEEEWLDLAMAAGDSGKAKEILLPKNIIKGAFGPQVQTHGF
ncbi:hypothetical protein TIFTF001_035824 [Ficus carica]|uniref:Uncharacterized protein n=1 Tax=Ficus carica TaxID=3494 RepID=A0AA88E2K7_FICCA|nr:hypothetical protein TIFTF001_035797 [Ficus carica]GMN66744.1 hypothetical protein TIFTF001_035808 [Ficus carica]GMN66745.1 hypothetical protein TIFTF001_035813 [Ficus carica]GMN66760.1 hypothetical protein TIFTF001_035824 [Ficus carica]